MVSGFPLIKNAARRIVFPILDADGDPVTGATTPDSEYSVDGASFTDCTNEATEIATASGVYYLDLVAAETNGDVVAIQCKTASAGAKTTVLVFYTAAQSIDTIDTNIDSIVAKLPTNYIMGSAVLTAKDDEIDAIKTQTDALPTDPADQSLLVAEHDATQASIAALNNITAASVWAVATRALTDKAGFSLAADQSAVTVGTVTTLTTWDKTGYALSVAGIDAIVDDVVEGTLTLRQAIRLFLSALAGKSSGGGTATLLFRDNADTKARITATVDADGNRTAMTLDAT